MDARVRGAVGGQTATPGDAGRRRQAEIPDTDEDRLADMDVSRRTLIVGGTSAIVGAGVGAGVAGFVASDRTGPTLWQRGDRSGAPRVGGLHLQYGADASSEVVVSWHTASAVNNPRVMVGTPDDGFGRTIAAETVSYRDAASGTEIRVHHARLTGLAPDTDYVYAAVHDGASPELGTMRTAPRGRAPCVSPASATSPPRRWMHGREGVRQRPPRIALGR